MAPPDPERGSYVVGEHAGERLDAWIARRHPALSRSRWQTLIAEGRLRLNGSVPLPRARVKDGDRLEFEIPPPVPVELCAEAIPIAVLFEDADIVVLDKPAGLVVHPAPGHAGGTLVNALLHHCDDLEGIGGEQRPGIVHRLDRDTSGVMVVAKHERALNGLAAQFKDRSVRKEYLALVRGHPRPPAATIRTLFGRSPHDRKKMSARVTSGRTAITHYETAESFRDAALLRVRIETGRTHQIRVHLAHIGHPILGDHVYGHPRPDDPPAPRQMLHAASLRFAHPMTGAPLSFAAAIPADFAAVRETLRSAGNPGPCQAAAEKAPCRP
jgi:23S rRNA pseudouridine1911/1915/1917 synthase